MRGAIELPAILIFTVVAGALIIGFFVYVAQGQSVAGERRVEQASLERFDALLKSAATAPETENNITIIDETLYFMCDDTMRIEYGSGVQQVISNMIIFSPAQLTGGGLRVYSKGTNIPYRIGNVLYLSTDQFIIYNDTNLHEFPKNFALTRNQASAQRIVLPATARVTEPKKTVRVDEQPGKQYGRVYYETGSVVYPNYELLYGAVLSKDAVTYHCVAKQYYKQLRFVNKVQWLRVQALAADAEAACSQHYQFFPFEEIDRIASIGESDPTAIGEDEAKTLSEAQNQIRFMNDKLFRGDNCAVIY
jgi:hypothetical protein